MVRVWVHYKRICDELMASSAIRQLCVENSDQDWPAIHRRIDLWLAGRELHDDGTS